MEKLKILLADDQSLFAESLKTFLNNYAQDINVAGIARNGKEVIDMAASHKPDIILMDIRMPVMDGVEAVRQIKSRYPDIKIIMLSTYQEDALVRSALLAGASGYLLKDIAPSELISAIRALKSGVVQISPDIAHNLVHNQNKAENFEHLRNLTNRQRDVFNLIAGGYDNDQIALKLNLTVQTIRNCVSAIYTKLGVKNRFEIIRLANE